MAKTQTRIMEDQRAGTGAGSNWKETMEMDWPYAQKARQ